jgi:diguanylate cyclase (GGDEF)-like protein
LSPVVADLRAGAYSDKDHAAASAALKSLSTSLAAPSANPSPDLDAKKLQDVGKAVVDAGTAETLFWQSLADEQKNGQSRIDPQNCTALLTKLNGIKTSLSALFPQGRDGLASGRSYGSGPVNTKGATGLVSSMTRKLPTDAGNLSSSNRFWDGKTASGEVVGPSGSGNPSAWSGSGSGKGSSSRYTSYSTVRKGLKVKDIPAPFASQNVPPGKGAAPLLKGGVSYTDFSAMNSAPLPQTPAGGNALLVSHANSLLSPAAKTPAAGDVSAQPTACEQALAGHPQIAQMCRDHPTLAPLVAGLLDAVKEQFGTVQGIVMNLVFLLLGLVLSALSGFGLIAKVVVSLVSLGMLVGTLGPLLKEGWDAFSKMMGSAEGSLQKAQSLTRLGKVGGTVLILALMSLIGWGVGKTTPGKAAIGSMENGLSGAMTKLGVGKGAAALDASVPAPIKALLTRLFGPATPAAEKTAPAGGQETAAAKAKVPAKTESRPASAPALTDQVPAKVPLEKVQAQVQKELTESLKARGDHQGAQLMGKILDTDPMTGLPNRAFLERNAATLGAKLKDPTVAMLDMNNFGAINDGLAAIHGPSKGKLLGDGILASAGPRLLLAAKETGVTLGRFGGEEFVVIGERAQTLKFVERARTEFSDGQVLKDSGYGPGTPEYQAFLQAAAKKGRAGQSLGDFTYGVSSLKSRDFGEALKVADGALGKAKDTGHRGGALVEDEGDLKPVQAPEPGLKPTEGVGKAPGTAALLDQVAQLKARLLPNEYARFMENAFRDPLTNARTFDYLHLKAADWAKTYPQGTPAAMVSARGLKTVNDSLGHDAGDWYLRELGQMVRSEVLRARKQGLDVQEPVRVASKEFLLVGKDAPQVAGGIAASMDVRIADGKMFSPQQSEAMARYSGEHGGDGAGAGSLREVSAPGQGLDTFGALDGLVAKMETLKAKEAAAPRGSLTGKPAYIEPAESQVNKLALQRQNEAALVLAESGYQVHQNGLKSGPDYQVNGVGHDCYSPTTDKPRSIWTTVSGKVGKNQAQNFVLNLDGSSVDLAALQTQFVQNPIAGLNDILVVRGGKVIPLMKAGQGALPAAK